MDTNKLIQDLDELRERVYYLERITASMADALEAVHKVQTETVRILREERLHYGTN